LSFPHTSELGREPSTETLESLVAHPGATQIPGVVVYRFESALIYANAEAFANAARDLVEATDPPARVLVIDRGVMFGIDSTGTKDELENTYDRVGGVSSNFKQ
jgi:MFS superfamily sulfate permease-like transporter